MYIVFMHWRWMYCNEKENIKVPPYMHNSLKIKIINLDKSLFDETTLCKSKRFQQMHGYLSSICLKYC